MAVSLFLFFLPCNSYSLEEKKLVEERKPVEEQKQPSAQVPLYSAGPWMGKVIDSKIRMPIEGAVVAAVWYRMYDTRFTVLTDFHEAKEVLTDKDGYFEMPVYIETGEHKDSWPKPQIPGIGGPIEKIARGPIIKDPEVIIYKPGFNSYPAPTEMVIFATGPFHVEFQEFSIEKDNVIRFRKGIRDFPEGLVYAGKKCSPFMEKLREKTNLEFNSLFYSMDKAREEIKRLNIPLDCPQDAEPIPAFAPGYRYELENPFKKGGFIIIELSETTSDKERLKALPQEPAGASADKLPLLYRFIKEEREYLKKKK